MKNKWIYISASSPYTAIGGLGITKESSTIFNIPKMNWSDILDYEYLIEDNEEVDAIVVNEVGAIVNREALEHTKKKVDQMLDFEE